MSIHESTIGMVLTAVQFSFLFYVIVDLCRLMFTSRRHK